MKIDRTTIPLAAVASVMLAACGPSGGSDSDSDSDSENDNDTSAGASLDVAVTVALDGSWGSASAVENISGQAGIPAMTSLGGGQAVAVWSHIDDSFNASVRASARAANGNWSATEQLETVQDKLVTYIAMDSNASGQAIAIWQQDNHAWAAHYDTSTGWSSTTQLDNSANDLGLHELDVAIDANGNAMAVWRQDDSGGGGSAYASYYDSTAGTWSTDQLLESQDGWASEPKVAFNSEGSALVFWEQIDGTAYTSLYYRWYHTDTQWTSTQLFEQEEKDAESVQLAFDSNDNAIVVWDQQLGTQSDIRMRRYINGSGWGSTLSVEEDPSSSSRPVLAVAPDGDATIAFEHYDDGNGGIGTARYQADTDTLDAPLLLDTVDTGEVDRLTLAMDASGDAYLAWQQEDADSNIHLWGQRYLADQSRWTVSTELEAEAQTPATDPVAAAVDVDEGVVIWVEDSGPEAQVKHSVFTEN